MKEINFLLFALLLLWAYCFIYVQNGSWLFVAMTRSATKLLLFNRLQILIFR